MELEAQAPKVPNGSTTGPTALHSSAFPKSLLSARARNLFAANLRQAITEDETEDNLDPLLTSRHVGPTARLCAEEEKKERQEEQAKELRRSSRSRKPQNSYAVQGISSHKGKEVAGLPAQQPLLTYAPVSSHSEQSPVLVSNKGTRLRIKPPQPPQESHGSGSSGSHDLMAMHSPSSQYHQAFGYPLPSSPRPRSQSPISPMMSPHDKSSHQGSYSHRHYTNGTPRSTSNSNGSPPLSRRPSGSSHPSPNIPQHQQVQHQHQIQHPSPLPQPSTPGSNNSRGSDVQRHAKPKRLKAHTVTSRSFSIPMVPRDKEGRPMLPLNVGIMTVHSLGEVCMREHFHTERYIFPVGYEVTRYGVLFS